MKGYPFPCKGCKDRHVGCHSECNKYIEAKRKNEEIRATQEKESVLNESIYVLKNNRMKSFRQGHK